MESQNKLAENASVPDKNVTLSEILGQPQLWNKLSDVLKTQALPEAFRLTNFSEIILSGAGSSAFVAEAVAGELQSRTAKIVRAVATTDIVTHPKNFFSEGAAQLLISFARSGNSPESLASVRFATACNSKIRHLIITCNKDGELAKASINPASPGSTNTHVVILPEESNDKGLAMIGSVTGMILAALGIAHKNLNQWAKSIELTAQKLQAFMAGPETNRIYEIAQLDFNRVVCLGSGPMLGVAREAHLKIQELSDGQVIGKFDSYLGFRHGPKVVVNEKTLIIYFLSSDAGVRKYEYDLIRSIEKEQKPIFTWALSSSATKPEKLENITVDWNLNFEIPELLFEPEMSVMCFLPPVQILAAFKSLSLGLNPDAPSARGAIHRVVQGVTIYPMNPNS